MWTVECDAPREIVAICHKHLQILHRAKLRGQGAAVLGHAAIHVAAAGGMVAEEQELGKVGQAAELRR